MLSISPQLLLSRNRAQRRPLKGMSLAARRRCPYNKADRPRHEKTALFLRPPLMFIDYQTWMVKAGKTRGHGAGAAPIGLRSLQQCTRNGPGTRATRTVAAIHRRTSHFAAPGADAASSATAPRQRPRFQQPRRRARYVTSAVGAVRADLLLSVEKGKAERVRSCATTAPVTSTCCRPDWPARAPPAVPLTWPSERLRQGATRQARMNTVPLK
jgi:hypothetical protein